MKRSAICAVVLAALAISDFSTSAQTKSGIDKLYILNCGEGVAGDISRWSPGVNVGKSMDFVDNCYLMGAISFANSFALRRYSHTNRIDHGVAV